LTHFAGIPVDTDKICPAGLVTHIFLTDLKRTTVPACVYYTELGCVFGGFCLFLPYKKRGLDHVLITHNTDTHLFTN